MSDIKIAISQLFDLNPNAASKRIFFGKESQFTLVWHIFDAALRLEDGTTVALHDEVLFENGRIKHIFTKTLAPQYTADSLTELQRKTHSGDYVCVLCFREMELALEEIKRDDLLKFT